MEWDGRFGAIWCPSCKTEFWLSGPTRTRWIVIGLRALIVIGGLLFAYELFAK
jgi:hypothetical protein